MRLPSVKLYSVARYKPFGSIRNCLDWIYPWAISLTLTTFCSLPWRFSFLFLLSFFFFFMMTYCIANVWHCNTVPTDSFSITSIWQGETDFKTLIFHQYFTWNLQSRCLISLDLRRGALTFFSTLSYPWRWDWKDTLTWRKAFFFPTQIKWINCHIPFIQKRFDEENDSSEFFLLLAIETGM